MDFLKNKFPKERSYVTMPAEHSNPSLATLPANFAEWGWLQQDRALTVDIYISLKEWNSRVFSLSSSAKYQKLRDSHRWKTPQIFQNMHVTSIISIMDLKESDYFTREILVFLAELRATAGLATEQKTYISERKIRKQINCYCYHYFIICCQKGAFVSCHHYI